MPNDNSPTTDENTERLYLYPSEIEALLKACQHISNPLQAKLVLTLLYHHGLRVSELINLQWRDINFESASIFIRRAKGSNNSTHSINGDELRLLKRAFNKTKSIYVIINPKNPNIPLTARTIQRWLNKLADIAKLKIKVHPHMLRHSCGYYLADKGIPLREIQDYLGHKNVNNTVHYTRLNPNKSRHYF